MCPLCCLLVFYRPLATRDSTQCDGFYTHYWSGYWHHDRCGRRLKAFLFLHDVLPDGRPTMVANASHRTHYFSYDWLKGSRFADKYIRANYDVVPMTGKRGGGFIFDTNAIHKGTSRKSTSTAWRSRAATI